LSAVDEFITACLDECRRHGIQAGVRVVTDRREELVARNGAAEEEGVTEDATVSLMVTDGDHLTVLSGGLDVEVPTMVAEGLTVLRTLSGTAEALPATRSGSGNHRAWAGRAAAPLDALRDEVLAAAVMPGARECELRANQVNRTVDYADDVTRLSATSSFGQLVLRATRTAEGGEAVHVDRMDSGPDVRGLLSRFVAEAAGDARGQLLSPAAAATEPLPTRVVLDASVAAQMVCLLAESLSAEAVAQGRSLFGDKLGEMVCAPQVSIVDDPMLPAGPRHLPFDDEGVIGSRTVLVDQGRLLGFFGSRGYEHTVKGSVPGSARQPDAVTAPRPAASNLFIAPGTQPLDLAVAPTLRIVQTHGMHLSNPITGEFSTGASALVYGDGGTRLVTGLSMAGNVADLCRGIDAVGSELSWTDDADASFGAPALLVTGLSIGR
jgi:PmbA protein